MESLRKVQKEVKDAPVLKQLAADDDGFNNNNKDDEELDGTGVLRNKKGKVVDFEKMWRKFTGNILEGGQQQRRDRKAAVFRSRKSIEASPPGAELWQDLREAYRIRGTNGLEDRIKFAFYGHVTGSRFTASDVRHQKILADLRYPSEWFPATRALQREIHLHVGPTNSGKTYHALKRLEQANSGAYAGPLRLLAHEVYTRMNAKGKACALITGEERRAMDMPSEATSGAGNPQGVVYSYDMMACTVEMMPLNKSIDVAVIDEIQMIGDPNRGWAWTQAVLGVKAKEVHLCGEERTVPLIKELCASIGEKLTVHHYERLSPLMVADSSLNGDLKKLRKGDCIVSFSVMGIHALRKQIERQTGRKVATVYGSLPPETRAQQARLFNDPDNEYDFLVASDAVGMGLNLAIKRVIFETSNKFDGVARRTLSVADIKQIGGRAGRFRIASQVNEGDVAVQDLSAAKGESGTPSGPKASEVEVLEPSTSETSSTAPSSEPNTSQSLDPEPPSTSEISPSRGGATTRNNIIYKMPPSGDVPSNIGIITTLERFDYPIVRAAMSAQPEPILTAGLFPPGPVLERFSSYFPPGTPFSYILTRLHELSQMHSRFHLCGLKDQVWIADLIEGVQGLTVGDRNVICSSPASKGDAELWGELMPEFARCIAEQKGGGFLEIRGLPLEVLDQEISVRKEYLRALERLHKGIVSYLWLSFRFHGIFTGRGVAVHAKGLVEERIEGVLKEFSFSEKARRKVVEERERKFLEGLSLFGEGGKEEEGGGVRSDESGSLVDGEEVGSADDGEQRAHGGSEAFKDVLPGDELDVGAHDATVSEVQGGPVEGGGQFSGEGEDVIFEEDEKFEVSDLHAEKEAEVEKFEKGSSA